MSATETIAPAIVNDNRRADFMKQVGALGRESALGKDSLPKLAHAVVKASADGVIDADEKNDKGDDIATVIYENYARNESNKAIHEHSKSGVKANASKLRQLIKMGAMTTVDAVEIMQAAFEAREAAIADDVKVKSAYPYYVDVARKQLETDKPLTSAELAEIVRKPEAAPKELETELKAILKRLEGLVSGENKAGLRDEDELTEAAMHSLKERLDKMAFIRQTMELREKAAALGITLAN
jgi:ElaB/YqjD/DUF883 family membrane-anchored ribosome-binding protein